ncbi:hypothetical protein [Ornithobacterium rhinotracheale]|uniref:hypothetical protein n=1 Tax=Ornithobacterium rhinotracheale TaxID=28251 RepID=UPI00129C90DF|nr:hypothetical protein [Ornithobacterium rhinotracheale]
MMEKFAIIHEDEEYGQILITRENQNQEIQVQFEMEGERVSFKIKNESKNITKKLLLDDFKEFESKDYTYFVVKSFFSDISELENLETAQQQNKKNNSHE